MKGKGDVQKKAVFIAYDECAIWQVALLQKFLRRAGWQLTTITVDGQNVYTDGGVALAADLALENANPADYSLLLFPGVGGEIKEALIENSSLKTFIQKFEGFIAASCASALFLASAGKLKERFTTTDVIKEKYNPYFMNYTYTNEDVCVDHQMITSKGHAHIEFMHNVLEQLGLFNEDPRLEKVVNKLAKNA